MLNTSKANLEWGDCAAICEAGGCSRSPAGHFRMLDRFIPVRNPCQKRLHMTGISPADLQLHLFWVTEGAAKVLLACPIVHAAALLGRCCEIAISR